MTWPWIILLAVALWLILAGTVYAIIIPWLANAPGESPVTGLIWRVVRLYALVVHRVRFEGFEEFRRIPHPGPLIVVSNHTGAVDPLLIQAACRFPIRWMMASEMMSSRMDWLWRQQRLIPVDRDGRDAGPAREAIRHVQSGGIIGIFPEGRIVNPPEQIRPFYMGVGLIVARAQAPVLLVWISGTPKTNRTMESLTGFSEARVKFVDLIDFQDERDGHVITAELRRRLAEISRWPINDQKMPPHVKPALEW
ncbi:MAG TPA: lysophospholipid acyltransferase family protein [Phycisphaerales bacterium]|nr:lysophospholipid acyltransferase family protein [Phycisphaerales bacterium]